MKKKTCLFLLLTILIFALPVSGLALNPPKGGWDCGKVQLVNHSFDKLFHTYGVSIHCQYRYPNGDEIVDHQVFYAGSWEQQTELAEEFIDDHDTYWLNGEKKNDHHYTYHVSVKCSDDPWLTETPSCYPSTYSASPRYPIWQARTYDIPMPYQAPGLPKSSTLLPKSIKQSLRKKYQALFNSPTIILPVNGATYYYPQDIPVKIQHNPTTGIRFKIYWRKNTNHSFQQVTDSILFNLHSENGITQAKLKPLFKGEWSLKVQQSSDVTGKWSSLCTFQVKDMELSPSLNLDMFHKVDMASALSSDLTIISPAANITYANTVPIKVTLPGKLDEETTMTLNWIWGYSAPAAAPGQVPEASAFPKKIFSQKITVEPGVGFAESEMSVEELMQHKDSAFPGFTDKSGEYSLEVTMKEKQGIKRTATKGGFFIGMLGKPVRDNQGKKKSGALLLDTPIFTTPAEGQIFLAPARVEITMIHQQDMQVQTEMGYCPLSKEKTSILYYQTLNIKPVSKKQKDKGTTTLVYELKKPGFYRVRAINNDKIGIWSQWRSFKVDTLDSKTVSSIKSVTSQGIASSKAPRIIAPANHAVFQEGQAITLKIDTHGTTKPMTDEVQFKDRKNTFTLLYTGTAGQSTTGGTVETPLMISHPQIQPHAKGAAEYRVRVAFAHKDEKGFLRPEEYSPWLYIKILPSLKTPAQIPQKSFIPAKSISAAQLKKSGPAGIMGQKSINPQPEPPGKQLRTIPKNLVIMPHPRNFRPGTPIAISIKNTPFSRVPFELRYRPAPGKAYQMVKHPKHSFKRINGVTSLRLELKQPGEYQLRFRANHKAPWTNWSSFQIMENPAKAAALAQKMRVTPVTARMINPQPEPPGKVRRHQVHKTAGKEKKHPNTVASFSPAATARNIHIAPPKIERPRNGQKFLLTGKSVQVQARISYAGKQKIQVELQRKTGHRFGAIHPRISFTKSHATTTATISLQQTGNYRLRVRAGSNARWSGWTTFSVDTLMKNMPSLQQHTPAPEQKTPAEKSALSTKPGLPMVR